MHIPETATELADLIDRIVGPSHYGQPVDGMLTRAATLLREQADEIDGLRQKEKRRNEWDMRDKQAGHASGGSGV